MARYVYAVTCERNSKSGKDWYVLNPVYSEAEAAEAALDQCRKHYSKIGTIDGNVYECKYSMEKIKVSGPDWKEESE